jgi:hypothetical protein
MDMEIIELAEWHKEAVEMHNHLNRQNGEQDT